MDTRIIKLKQTQSHPQTAHILPCTIQCDKEQDTTRFFKPVIKQDGTTETYLRGRKLIGHSADLPAGYHGYIFDTSQASRTISKDDELVEVKEWRQIASFDKVIVHGNTCAVEPEQDAYLKAIQEWTQLAAVLHSTD